MWVMLTQHRGEEKIFCVEGPIDEVVNFVVEMYGNILKRNHYMMVSNQI